MDELLKAFKHLSVTIVSDAMDRLGLQGVLDGIYPLVEGLKLTGRAFTVQGSVEELGTYSLSDFRVGDVIDAAGEDKVIVFSLGGACVSAWGGLASLAAKGKGVAGVVVDGGARDVEDIRRLRFPVYAKYRTPRSGKRRVKLDLIDTPIQVGRVTVKPEDMVLGDDTGLVVVDSAKASEVLQTAKELEKVEKRFINLVRRGVSFKKAAEELRHM